MDPSLICSIILIQKKEISHLPAREGKRRKVWNANYVPDSLPILSLRIPTTPQKGSMMFLILQIRKL